jgi:hypothetical protein
VIDTKRGYWPTRLVLESQGRNSQGELFWKTPPEVQSEVDVQQFDGVWLPINYSVSNRNERKDSFKLQWDMVNGDLDPRIFTNEGIN